MVVIIREHYADIYEDGNYCKSIYDICLFVFYNVCYLTQNNFSKPIISHSNMYKDNVYVNRSIHIKGGLLTTRRIKMKHLYESLKKLLRRVIERCRSTIKAFFVAM